MKAELNRVDGLRDAWASPAGLWARGAAGSTHLSASWDGELAKTCSSPGESRGQREHKEDGRPLKT